MFTTERPHWHDDITLADVEGGIEYHQDPPIRFDLRQGFMVRWGIKQYQSIFDTYIFPSEVVVLLYWHNGCLRGELQHARGRIWFQQVYLAYAQDAVEGFVKRLPSQWFNYAINNRIYEMEDSF